MRKKVCYTCKLDLLTLALLITSGYEWFAWVFGAFYKITLRFAINMNERTRTGPVGLRGSPLTKLLFKCLRFPLQRSSALFFFFFFFQFFFVWLLFIKIGFLCRRLLGHRFLGRRSSFSRSSFSRHPSKRVETGLFSKSASFPHGYLFWFYPYPDLWLPSELLIRQGFEHFVEIWWFFVCWTKRAHHIAFNNCSTRARWIWDER